MTQPAGDSEAQGTTGSSRMGQGPGGGRGVVRASSFIMSAGGDGSGGGGSGGGFDGGVGGDGGGFGGGRGGRRRRRRRLSWRWRRRSFRIVSAALLMDYLSDYLFVTQHLRIDRSAGRADEHSISVGLF